MSRVAGLLTSVCLLSLAATGCGPKADKPAPPAVTTEAAGAKLVGVWEAEQPAGKSEREQAVLDIVDLRVEMEFTPDQVTSRTSMRNLKTGEIETSESTGAWQVVSAAGNELTVELPAKDGFERQQVQLLGDDRLEMKPLKEPDIQPQRWNRVPAADKTQ